MADIISCDIFEKYIEESCGDIQKKSKREHLMLLKRFFSNLPEGVEYDNLSKQDITEAFTKSSIMTASSFGGYCSKIKDFMLWLNKSGYETADHISKLETIDFESLDCVEHYKRYYFSSYEDLQDTLDTILMGHENEYMTFRVAVILVWFGIEVKYLPELLKADWDNENKIIIHPVTKKKIKLPAKAAQLLTWYTTSEYDKTSYDRLRSYKPSRYLFRSYKNESLTVRQIRDTARPINDLKKRLEKTFQWERIYDSGLFSRVAQYEKDHGEISSNDAALIKEVFEMRDFEIKTNQHKYSLKTKYLEYQKFKNQFLG